MCLAVPGKLINVDDAEPLQRTGEVSFGGVVKRISLAFVPEAEVGDYLLVHAGIALSLVDEEEAGKVFEYLSEIEAGAGDDEADQ